MKKLLYCFNWAVFMVFIIALSSFNAPSWTAEIVAVISGGYLAIVGEINGVFTAGVKNADRR